MKPLKGPSKVSWSFIFINKTRKIELQALKKYIKKISKAFLGSIWSRSSFFRFFQKTFKNNSIAGLFIKISFYEISEQPEVTTASRCVYLHNLLFYCKILELLKIYQSKINSVKGNTEFICLCNPPKSSVWLNYQ